MKKFASFWKGFGVLLRNVPSPIVALFCVSVVSMNLLANKTIVNLPYLALDGGFAVSWIAFLTMDVVTKHFGGKAAQQLNLFALGVNLLMSLIFYWIALIPTSGGDEGFNTIFGGSWFVLLSSSVAFLLSGWVNIGLNALIGKAFSRNPDGKTAFFVRSYVSTFIGQFVDNFTFAALCFMVFAPIFWDGFSWTPIQCLTCSLTGAVAELLMEVVFSPLGYATSRRWKKLDVGKEYFEWEAKQIKQ